MYHLKYFRAQVFSMKVLVRHYSDPACPWSWAAETTLRRLMWEFADELEFAWVMGGLARSYGSEYRDSQAAIGSGPDCFADLIRHWLDVADRSGMPIDPRFWADRPIASTYPGCLAVKAACEQGSEAGYRYLRRLREGLMYEGKRLDHAEALVAAAGEAELDVSRFEIDLHSAAITEAFAADLEEARDIPDAARQADQVSETEGKERLSFPSLVFIGDGDERHGVYGYRPYAEYRAAATAAGAVPQAGTPPAPLAAIERFGRIATAELEELTQWPRPPLEAELWALARDWKAKPVPALTGTLWEPA
ncbi:MAG: DsbA family protein [Solirubrobacterales bacterium]